jgi:hypothetical protein
MGGGANEVGRITGSGPVLIAVPSSFLFRASEINDGRGEEGKEVLMRYECY